MLNEYEFTTENFARDLTSDQVLLKGKGPKITIDISANVDELEIDNALIDEEIMGVTENGRSWPVQEKIKSQNFSKKYFFLILRRSTRKG